MKIKIGINDATIECKIKQSNDKEGQHLIIKISNSSDPAFETKHTFYYVGEKEIDSLILALTKAKNNCKF